MGYTTDFNGEFKFSRPLTVKEKKYLNTFSKTRRMCRDVNKIMELHKGKHGNPHPLDDTAEGIYGKQGEYFAKDDGNFGQNDDTTVLNHNGPGNMPGLWCQWEPDEDGKHLRWDNGEKFYNYVEWLKFLIEHFFNKWGVSINGECEWAGESSDDLGKIMVKDNIVTVLEGQVTYKTRR